MYSLFDSYFPTTRTIYVVSDVELADLKKRQAQAELTSLNTQRAELDRAYEQRKGLLDARVEELNKQVQALSPVEEKEEVAA